MNQLKNAQNSVETCRKRNNSLKNEIPYVDLAKRRRSLFMDQMENQSQNQLKNQTSFLPQLKQESDTSSGNNSIGIVKIHFRLFSLMRNQMYTYCQQLWDFFQKYGDIYDIFQDLFKKFSLSSQINLIKKFNDICFYEKIIITLGYEKQHEQQFLELIDRIQHNYCHCIRELLTIGKFNKKELQDFIMPLSYDYQNADELYDKLQQSTSSIQMIQKKCKCNGSYKLNYKIIRRHFALWLHETRSFDIMRSLPKLLLTAQHPFLTQKINKPTLIIDLDETLVHYDQGTNKLYIRNGCLQFLQSVHSCFQIIVWTASLPRYARWALKKIDQKIEYENFLNSQVVDLLLTREYCVPHERGHYQKFLHMLGLELSTLLIVENDVRSVIDSEKDQMFLVDSFIGQEDLVLSDLAIRLVEAFGFYKEGFSFQRAVKMTYIK